MFLYLHDCKRAIIIDFLTGNGAGTFAEFRQVASGLQNSAKVPAPRKQMMHHALLTVAEKSCVQFVEKTSPGGAYYLNVRIVLLVLMLSLEKYTPNYSFRRPISISNHAKLS